MDKNLVLSKVDHTILSPDAKWEDIKRICDEAKKEKTASVCIPQCYVKDAVEYLKNEIPVCTVIGFPNGNSTTETKCFEAQNAIDNGAKEIDMVINIGFLKDKKYDKVKEEIKKLAITCHDLRPTHKQIILKVIIETCLLTDDEIRKMVELCYMAGADYIKTSTGFSKSGANEHVLQIMANEINLKGYDLKIKAAGGISDIATAEKFLEIGASRLGTSKLIRLYNQIN